MMAPAETRKGRRADRERGQAMVIALTVLAFLMIVISATSVGLRVQSETVAIYTNDLRGRYIALAGVERGVYELAQDDAAVDTLGDRWHRERAPSVFGNVQFGEKPGDSGFFDVRYARADGKGWQIGIADEARKLNLNGESRNALLKLWVSVTHKEMKDAEKIVDAIMARRGTLRFVSVTELQGVDGMSVDDYQAMAPFLTVWGDGRINVNTADEDVLSCFFSREASKKIIALRNGKDGLPMTADDQAISAGDALADVSGMAKDEFDKVKPRLTVSSEYFIIDSHAVFNPARNLPTVSREFRAVVRRDGKGVEIVRLAEVR